MDSRLLSLWCMALCFVHSFSAVSSSPSLSITNLQGQFVLAWPLSATNWVLERSTGLAPGSWFRVSTTLYQSNAVSRYAVVPGVEASAFYRLRQLGPPLPGVAGYWRLDEGFGQLAEGESGLQTVMLFTNTTWAPGRIGPAALGFGGGQGEGGSRAWVSNAGYRLLPVSGQPWSLSLWFSPDAVTPGRQILVRSNDGGTNGWDVALQTAGLGTNHVVFRSAGAPTSLNVSARTLLLPGQWHELTVTHDGSQGSIYLDSRLLAQGVGQLPMQDGPIYFGGGVGNFDGFVGRLDDIRIYTNCLTAEQISVAGHWRFDENTGLFAADSGIKGQHATLSASSWAPGRNGSGVQLNTGQVAIRNDEYTVLPGSGGSFSLSFWLRPDLLLEGRSGLMSCGTVANDGWQLAVEVNGSATQIHLASTNSGGTLDVSAPLGLTNGVWTKIDLTHNGGIATLYANGRKLQARNGAIRGSKGALIVGAVPGLPKFGGVIDDLKIYSYERDAAEIGPVATTMWETAFINSTTNIALQGYGPAGKALTYSVVPIVAQTNGSVEHPGGTAVVTYAAGGRKGPDAFAYTVSDGEFTSEPAMVTLSIVQPHWLSPSPEPDGSKDGGAPERAWPAGRVSALDAIWRTNSYYDCFFYAPGEYETTGFKYLERSTANPGCKHIGSGSTGANPTVVRLVGAMDPTTEGYIFAPIHKALSCDGFEVHNMILDGNAHNNPKYAVGEPVSIRIPLRTNSWVESVSLRWWRGTTSRGGPGTPIRFGEAVEFSLCRMESSVTNCTSLTHTGVVDVVAVGANTDELLLQLTRRPTDVDFYSLAEIEVSGADVSLPSATGPGGGQSRFNAEQSILAAIDGNHGTMWSSGGEPEVKIVLPLARGTRVSQLNLYWNCRTFVGLGRFGAAAAYAIRARDEATGQDYDVPFTRQARTADGLEPNTFGTNVVTDQLTILLTNRASMVDYYSLREVTLQNGSVPVNVRVPTTRSSLIWDANRGLLQAFDQNAQTQWASATQGLIGGINLAGNNMKFSHLKIIGFGSKIGAECFPLFVVSAGEHGPPFRYGNIIIEDCLITEPATNNTDVLTAIALAAFPPDTLTNAVIRRCTVTGVGQHFETSQAFAAMHMENCLIEDCNVGLYFEPLAPNGDDIGPVFVRSNRFLNVDNGIFVRDHPGAQFDSLTCLDNEIVLRGVVAGWGIASCDVCAVGPSGSISNVTALNNIIRYADWQPRPRNDGGIFYSDIQHAVYGNNIIALGSENDLRVRHCPAGTIFPPPPTEDCEGNVTVTPGTITHPPCLDPPLPGYRRAWFNNRNFSGPLLDVRFWNRGFEGLFSQQQWPE
jgi:hypothetical protein